ncbi:MAG: SAF domain-containing protein [Actinomycetia bacterium]|nr:SAF domain-containing protein [Actinomycetes bacterium]
MRSSQRQAVTSETDTTAPVRIRSQRNPRVIGLGIVTIALGGLGAAWVFTSMTSSVPVVAMAQTVSRGALILSEDVTVANVPLDPALRPVSAARIDEMVGQRAAYDLPSGTLLTVDAATAALVPGPGQSIVGIAVPATRLPVEGPNPGDRVRIVDTPREGDEPPVADPRDQSAQVMAINLDPESGYTIVDVAVPEESSARLAARAATGRVAVVLDSSATS